MAEQRKAQNEWMREMETRLSQPMPTAARERTNEPPSTSKGEGSNRWARPPYSGPEATNGAGDRKLRVGQPMQRPAVRCFGCNQLGHLKMNCRKTPINRPNRASVNFNS